MGDLEPITRNEKLWSGEDLTPVTRREMYIKHLYDETQVIPEYPVTREEMFILKAGEELHDVTIEQLTATENKTYSEEGVAYSPVIVNVPLPENAYLLKEIEDVEIATFTEGSDLPMPKLEVAIEPVQDLHGYDAPWVGGAGKNKLPLIISDIKSLNTSGTWNGNTYTINNVAFTIKTDDGGNVIGIATSGIANSEARIVVCDKTLNLGSSEYYTLSGCPSGGGDSTYNVGCWRAGSGSITEIGNGQTFSYSEPIRFVVSVNIKNGTNSANKLFQPMIESGSTKTSYAPYSNICPISGWDECKVGVVGKNMFRTTAQSKTENGVTYNVNNDGTIDVSGTATGYTALELGSAYVDSSMGEVTISALQNVNNMVWNYIGLYDSDDNVLFTISSGGGQSNYTIDLSQYPTAYRIGMGAKRNNNVATSGTIKPQVEFGSTPTEYTPYTDSHTYTIDLDGTRYGGKVDLVSGVMTVDRAMVDLGSCAWDVRSESVIRCAVSAEAKFESQYKAVNGICSAYIIVAQNSLGDGKLSFNNSTQIYLQDNSHTFSTQSDAQQYLNGQKLVYELATPLTIQLSPTVVKSLRGMNNVFADSGNILDLSYLAKEE